MNSNPVHGELYSIQHYVLKVCQWLTTGRWFSPGTPVSSTNKTNRHDVAELLLKVALNTMNQPNQPTNNILLKRVVSKSKVRSILLRNAVYLIIPEYLKVEATMNGANVYAEFSKEGLGGVRVNEIRLRVKLIYTLYTYKLTTTASLKTKL